MLQCVFITHVTLIGNFKLHYRMAFWITQHSLCDGVFLWDLTWCAYKPHRKNLGQIMANCFNKSEIHLCIVNQDYTNLLAYFLYLLMWELGTRNVILSTFLLKYDYNLTSYLSMLTFLTVIFVAYVPQLGSCRI